MIIEIREICKPNRLFFNIYKGLLLRKRYYLKKQCHTLNGDRLNTIYNMYMQAVLHWIYRYGDSRYNTDANIVKYFCLM